MTFSPIPENRIQFSCGNCNSQLQAVVEQVVIPGTPALQQLSEGKLNRVRCSQCGQEGFLPFPFIFFLPNENRAVCFVHEADKMEEGQRNQIVQQLATVVQAATGGKAALQSVALTGDYGQMVSLAQAVSNAGSQDTPPPLAFLQKLIMADQSERYSLMSQNVEMLKEVKEVATTLMQDADFLKENPDYAAPLQNILAELDYSFRHLNENN